MLHTEPIPIEMFVNMKLMKAPIGSLLDEWRLEPENVAMVLVRHFREMGVFSVSAAQGDTIFRAMQSHLRNAPEILKARRRARQDELRRRHSRHADSFLVVRGARIERQGMNL